MKLLELHILQSFPVSCLNRGEDGTPKTALFGGVLRARLSSQCQKRATRLAAKDLLPDLYQGIRTRYIAPLFSEALERQKVEPAKAAQLAQHIAAFFNDIDPKDPRRVKTVIFLSPQEIDDIAIALAPLAKTIKVKAGKADPDTTPDDETEAGTKEDKKMKTEIQKACRTASRMDAADIAIFGRMVANDHTISIDGAAMFSHALSTHQAEPELDFYSAVDEAKPVDSSSGAAKLEALGYTSATYYRYAALNLDMLADAAHLGSLSIIDRQRIVGAFIRATLLAVPGARKTSMNAHTAPSYVLGLIKDEGQPMQLINAFEQPIVSQDGLMDASITALKKHRAHLETTWNITPAISVTIPETSLNEFCAELERHVP